MLNASAVKSQILGRDVRPLQMSAADCADFSSLSQIGINLSDNFVVGQMGSMGGQTFGMDSALMTPASIATPVQFLQAWLPGFVRVTTAARKIDEILGIQTIGNWEDEEIVQGTLEPIGEAALYGDYSTVPLSSYNVSFERRTVIRWEKGIKVGTLADARASRLKINHGAEQRNAAIIALDIARNKVGFYGFNGGANRTYGLLNDPTLPAYVTAAATGAGSSSKWKDKTFLQITADIRGMFAKLETAAGGRVNLITEATTLTVAMDVHQYFSVTNDNGMSVRQWVAQTYPKCRIVAAPEFSGANGGASVAYLVVDVVNDGGTDGGQAILQAVPSKFFGLGTEKTVKGYVESFSNATAGVFVSRPFAAQRLTGI